MFPSESPVRAGVAGSVWVLTASGPRQMSALVGRQHVSIVNGHPFTSAAEGVQVVGEDNIAEVFTDEGYRLRLSTNQRLQRADGSWCAAGHLMPGHSLRLQCHTTMLDWPGPSAPTRGREPVLADATSSSFHRTLLRSLCTSAQLIGDGAVIPPAASVPPETLQRMLLRLGLPSRVRARDATLFIARPCLIQLVRQLGPDHSFAIRIGQQAAAGAAGGNGSCAYVTSVLSVLAVVGAGREPLFSCSVPGARAFDANGFVAHDA